MKILTIGNFKTPALDGSITDENHIANTLEQMGHEVVRVQRDEVSFVDGDNNYDFTLVSQWDGYGDLSWLPQPIVYWAFDYQADGQKWHEQLIEESDLYLSKRIADSKYLHWRWLSQDFAPEFLDRIDPPKKDIDILFTGSYLWWADERNATIQAINDKFNLVVHSANDWPFLDRQPPMMDDKLPELYSRAKIVLSVDHIIEAGYWSDRNAQIMACGGFVLFRYTPLSEATFHNNVAYFYSIDDCLDKIQEYLNSDIKREIIAERGYEYARNNLMVKHRVQDLLNIVEEIL